MPFRWQYGRATLMDGDSFSCPSVITMSDFFSEEDLPIMEHAAIIPQPMHVIPPAGALFSAESIVLLSEVSDTATCALSLK
jgi:hypothetical protein